MNNQKDNEIKNDNVRLRKSNTGMFSYFIEFVKFTTVFVVIIATALFTLHFVSTTSL